MEFREISRNVHEARHKYKKGFEQWYLLSSDHHRDNPKCVDKLVLKHLEQAKERNAGVLMFGDYFCCMQGKYDKRADKKSLRPEHQVNNYFDALIKSEVEFLKPYAENICLIGYGNHETSILKRNETDLVERLVSGINLFAQPKNPVYRGGYGGWIKFKFDHVTGGNSQTFYLKYRHSGGSLGEVTKGVLGVDRMAKAFPDADIIVSGHNHESWTMRIQRERINTLGNIYLSDQLHVKLPTYKEEYGDGFGGFHVERDAPPKPLGAYWLKFTYEDAKINFQIIEAR